MSIKKVSLKEHNKNGVSFISGDANFDLKSQTNYINLTNGFYGEIRKQMRAQMKKHLAQGIKPTYTSSHPATVTCLRCGEELAKCVGGEFHAIPIRR